MKNQVKRCVVIEGPDRREKREERGIGSVFPVPTDDCHRGEGLVRRLYGLRKVVHRNSIPNYCLDR